MQDIQRYHTARRVTLLSASANLLLAITKVIFGLIGRSHALFADGIDSFADLFSDFLVFMAAKAGSLGPDKEHPYGHGRIETMITVGLAILLLVSGSGIIFNAWRAMVHARFGKPGVYTLIIAFISIVTNEGLFRYIITISKRINSNALHISAWHHRGDAFSSLVVLIGIGGAILGVHYLDEIAAVIVALMIIRMALKMVWHSLRELVDTSVNATTLQKINASIAQIAGVQAVHQLRTRLMGGLILVEVHVLVDPHISVSEGHFVADQVMKKIQFDEPKVVDVLVHIDVEDDETIVSQVDLPGREELQNILQRCWHDLPGCNLFKDLRLHYLHDKIEIEILLPLDILQQVDNLAELQQQYENAVRDLDYVASVKILLSID
ncbi:MAG: cation diffusion facilitator family transporter [Gammaproteobacteria bacterium]|jgi:cation diffusion facilitator family transporter